MWPSGGGGGIDPDSRNMTKREIEKNELYQTEINVAIEEAITRSALPLTRGGMKDDGFEFSWYGRRQAGLPENFYAIVWVGWKKIESGQYYASVGVFGYNLNDHGQSFSSLVAMVLASFLEDRDGFLIFLNRLLFVEDLRKMIAEAWEKLPYHYQKMLREISDRERMFRELKERGLLRE